VVFIEVSVVLSGAVGTAPQSTTAHTPSLSENPSTQLPHTAVPESVLHARFCEAQPSSLHPKGC
jgi:hypothetical protein